MGTVARQEVRVGRMRRTAGSGTGMGRTARMLIAILGLLSAGATTIGDAHAQTGFGFERVAEYAQTLAARAFQPPGLPAADVLKNLDYDDYRNIRFRPDMALWRGERLFEIQLFHLGFLHLAPVHINVVANGQVVRVPFQRKMFSYKDVSLPDDLPEDLGFAGFRIHFPMHTPEYKDEVAVFLGASYFRVLGRDQRFGASARGLAVDTGMPSGEEFPFFREFWIVEPGEHDTELTLYALLDSKRVTGAYAFRILPGTETRVEVTSRIFIRDDIEKLGIAPLTSMYYFGENGLRRVDDYRPEVHDSDGLLVNNGGNEWIWRPLVNPGTIRGSAFIDDNPRGFGLMQRDREFANYLDLEAHYHDRPSLWVEPIGGWGPGAVELIEIPSKDETDDNIVAMWVPNRTVKKGDVLDYSYRLFAQLESPSPPSMGHAVRTRIGSPRVPGSAESFSEETRLFVVDFEGGSLSRLSSMQPVVADVTASAGRIVDVIVSRIDRTGAWRVAFRLDPEGAKAVDVKSFLSLRGLPLTENWTYLWTPSLTGR